MLSELITIFILGLLTPTTAVCVLPLYPGFIAYLSNQLTDKENRRLPLLLGLLVLLGVIVFMLLLGLLFTSFLQISLTKVIGIVSPIAFILLSIISLLLIFNIDIGKFFPKIHFLQTKNTLWNAFLFGFFFGAIVIPCNPLFIAAFFTKALFTIGFLKNMLNFLVFSLGIGFPLLILAIASSSFSRNIITFLVRYKRIINMIAGILMLIISLYYLIFIFKLFSF